MQGADKGINVEELWRHSVTVAVAGSVVADEAGLSKPDGFTAGLLHDLGKLVLASKEGGKYARIIQDSREQQIPLTSVEKSVLGVDHAELGGELLRRWNLPPDVVAAVTHHHDLAAPPAQLQLCAAVHVANFFSHQLFEEEIPGAALPVLSPDALLLLQLTTEDLPRLAAVAQSELERVKGMLEI
jgi:putative nucleotidyltransferase with HDIG domain